MRREKNVEFLWKFLKHYVNKTGRQKIGSEKIFSETKFWVGNWAREVFHPWEVKESLRKFVQDYNLAQKKKLWLMKSSHIPAFSLDVKWNVQYISNLLLGKLWVGRRNKNKGRGERRDGSPKTNQKTMYQVLAFLLFLHSVVVASYNAVPRPEFGCHYSASICVVHLQRGVTRRIQRAKL